MSLSTQATPRSESAPPDNAANKWNDFAAKEFQEHRTRTFRTRHMNEPPSPQTPPRTRPLSPQTAPQSPIVNSPDSAHSWQTFAAQQSKSPQSESLPRRPSSSASGHATPRKSVSENARTVQTTLAIAPRQQRKPYLPDPPVCFCKREAYLRTIDDKVYYECHDYEEAGKRQGGTICGFHVHKDAWDRVRQQVRENKPVDKLDTTCPAFGFTFSVVMRINSPSLRQHWTPELPRCFCNKPVTWHWYAFKHTQRLYFSCPDLTTLDAPLRCGFFMYAEDAHFKLPEIALHSLLSPPSSSLSTSSYSSASSDPPKTDARAVSTPVSPVVPSSAASYPASPVAPSTALSINEDASIYNPPKPSIYIPQRARSVDDQRPNFIQVLQGAKPPAWYIPPDEDAQEEQVKHSISTLIPRSVLSYQALRNKKLDQERAKEKQLNEEKLEQLRQQIEALEQTVEQLQAENDQQRQLNSDKQQEIDALLAEQEHAATSHQALLGRAQKLDKEKDDLRDTMDSVQKELSEEIQLRQKSQQRYVQLELIVKDLLEAQDRLTKEVRDKEEKLNLKDLKCRVCFQENIEFALVPCYHCSYCKTCAEKLSECAICRTTKFAIQKVYMA